MIWYGASLKTQAPFVVGATYLYTLCSNHLVPQRHTFYLRVHVVNNS